MRLSRCTPSTLAVSASPAEDVVSTHPINMFSNFRRALLTYMRALLESDRRKTDAERALLNSALFLNKVLRLARGGAVYAKSDHLLDNALLERLVLSAPSYAKLVERYPFAVYSRALLSSFAKVHPLSKSDLVKLSHLVSRHMGRGGKAPPLHLSSLREWTDRLSANTRIQLWWRKSADGTPPVYLGLSARDYAPCVAMVLRHVHVMTHRCEPPLFAHGRPYEPMAKWLKKNAAAAAKKAKAA